MPGVPSGFKDIDEITGGFRKASLNIIAGRPSSGKTSLCLNIAENASIIYKKSVLVFSFEMSNEELFKFEKFLETEDLLKQINEALTLGSKHFLSLIHI